MNKVKRYTLVTLVIGSLLLFGLAACQPDGKGGDANEDTALSIVEMTMADYAFGTPDSIPSSWMTFQIENVGAETHEFILGRLPGGKTFEDLHSEVIQPLDSLQQLLIEGVIDSTEFAETRQQASPEWTGEIEVFGGGGLVGPGQTARTTLKLKPGEYVIVCSLLSPNGRRHDFQGMARPIIVTETSSETEAPKADVTLRSVGREVSVDGQLLSGEQTVALHVEKTPEDLEFPYGSVFLAPLGQEEDAEDLLDYSEDLHSIEFLGGVLAVRLGRPATSRWTLSRDAMEGDCTTPKRRHW
ncbi:MAG: hypothetical protein U5K69_13705 [Balneolaceae bacterium]|nr:hypothetical protein [Balneolaceae bacterium]